MRLKNENWHSWGEIKKSNPRTKLNELNPRRGKIVYYIRAGQNSFVHFGTAYKVTTYKNAGNTRIMRPVQKNAFNASIIFQKSSDCKKCFFNACWHNCPIPNKDPIRLHFFTSRSNHPASRSRFGIIPVSATESILKFTSSHYLFLLLINGYVVVVTASQLLGLDWRRRK